VFLAFGGCALALSDGADLIRFAWRFSSGRRSLGDETRRRDDWFIRIPYITEGFIQGLLGSVVAMLAVTALHTWYPLHNEFPTRHECVAGTNAVVLIVGVVIGSVGSAMCDYVAS